MTTWAEHAEALGDAILEGMGESVTFKSRTTLSRNTTTGVPTTLDGDVTVTGRVSAESNDEFAGATQERTITVMVKASALGSYVPKRDDVVLLTNGREYRVRSVERIHAQTFYRLVCFRGG